jgi:hypothetical protein
MSVTGKMIRGAVALSVATMLASAPASAAVIFNSLNITAATQATVGGVGGGGNSNSNAATYNALQDGSFNVQSTAKNKANGLSNAQTSVAVAFADPGHFLFDVTSLTSITNLKTGIAGSAKAGKYSFLYNFTLTTPGTLVANWDLSAPNSLQPAFGPLFGGGLQLAPTAVGTASQNLGAGTYNLSIIANFQDLLTKTGPGTVRGSSSDHFDFAITTVPEPATWGMMIVGFGAVAMQMRRRRTSGTRVLA